MQRKISSMMQGGREKRVGRFGNFWVLEFLVKRLSRIRSESVFQYLFLKGWSIAAGVVANSTFVLIRGSFLWYISPGGPHHSSTREEQIISP